MPTKCLEIWNLSNHLKMNMYLTLVLYFVFRTYDDTCNINICYVLQL